MFDAKLYRLLIFDVDGTVADRYSDVLYPHAKTYLTEAMHPHQNFFFATNQGGVGLRYWMQVGGFGQPENYPSVFDVEARMEKLFEGLHQGADAYAAAFAYQSKGRGKWAPIPPAYANDPRWHVGWRKPNPGMLWHAMRRYDVDVEDTLMIGDRPEDYQAAASIGVPFVWHYDFFGIEKRENNE